MNSKNNKNNKNIKNNSARNDRGSGSKKTPGQNVCMVFGVFFVLAGVGFMLNEHYLAGLLTFLGGVILIPSVMFYLRTQVPLKPVFYIILAILLITLGFVFYNGSVAGETEEETVTEEAATEKETVMEEACAGGWWETTMS